MTKRAICGPRMRTPSTRLRVKATARLPHPKLGPDGELDFAAARFHALEGLRQVRQTNFFGDKVVRGNVSAANRFQRFAEKAGRVMERGDELDFRIVNGR